MGGVADTAARLLRLLSLLQARPTWTASELAERLDVTTRTVRRDVARLRGLGYPVDAEAGPRGGYRLGRGGSLPPLLLDDDEAVAVALGLRAAADGSVTGLDDATVSALAKLEQVLPAPLAERARTIHGATTELQSRAPDQVDATVLVALAQGCRQSERLRIAYRDREGRASERLVDPLRLVRSGPRWYLVARDVERDSWRTLRVDRVSEVRPTRRPAAVGTDPPDPVALVQQAMAVGPYPIRARIRIALPMAQAVALLPRTVGVHTPDGPDATVVEIGAGDVAAMAAWLCGLRAAVTVLEPPELRGAVAAHARAVAEANQP